MFKEYLNSIDDSKDWKQGKYHQLKRKYGDYLYNQDRVKFNVDFEKYKKDKEMGFDTIRDTFFSKWGKYNGESIY